MTKKQIKILISVALVVFVSILRMTNAFDLFTIEKSITGRWIRESLFWVHLGIVWLIVMTVEKDKLLLWKETKRKWHFYALSAIGIFAGAVAVAVITPAVFDVLNLSLEQESLSGISNDYCRCFALLLYGCLTAGVTEEFINRGYIMPRIEAFTGKGWAIILISSVIFALEHVNGLNPVEFTVPFLIGLIFSWHYYKFRSIIAVMTAHFLIDFASFMTSC